MLTKLYRELHDITYHPGRGFGYVTLLQVWVWEHITIMQPMGMQERDAADPIAFN